MKITLLLTLLTAFSVSMAVAAETPAPPKKTASQLRHVVLFKFKDSATPADIKRVETAFRALPTQIPEIRGFEFGTNNSPENLAQGFTHCFFLTFDNEAGRAAYLPHPAHKAFGEVLRPFLDKVLVIDYQAGN